MGELHGFPPSINLGGKGCIGGNKRGLRWAFVAASSSSPWLNSQSRTKKKEPCFINIHLGTLTSVVLTNRHACLHTPCPLTSILSPKPRNTLGHIHIHVSPRLHSTRATFLAQHIIILIIQIPRARPGGISAQILHGKATLLASMIALLDVSARPKRRAVAGGEASAAAFGQGTNGAEEVG